MKKKQKFRRRYINFSGEYPWQVAILKKDPKESVYVCGGTLIDGSHILTAAHCVKTYVPQIIGSLNKINLFLF